MSGMPDLFSSVANGLNNAALDFTSNLPAVTAPLNLSSGGSSDFLSSLNQIANNITGTAKAYYGTQAQIEQAKAQAAIAKAQGQNAVQVASAGLPSPQLLLFGGLGLAAVLLLTKNK